MKIISGGQTGVDRAALDFALKKQIPAGGYCPKNRKAEDRRIPEKYPLKETHTKYYSERTKKNIILADATLLILTKKPDKGTNLTLKICNKRKKPYFQANPDKISPLVKKRFKEWLREHHIKTLNIAGSRESSSPGIYEKTLQFLEFLFT